MKKILSFLAIIVLTTPIVNTTIACEGTGWGVNPNPPKPPQPEPEKDIEYYQKLYDSKQKDYLKTKGEIDELKSPETIKELCGGIIICADLQELIHLTTIELYRYNVIMDDCLYQILYLENNKNITNPEAKVKAAGILTDELTTLTTIKLIMKLYPDNYKEKDLNEVNEQISKVQQLISELSKK
ncbi:hypothetical protein SSYRP_v1c04670 [Spiroplasma syrphidicola EA-1]|uniref:Lipoprotein n=1 Tax=Spiroplasma syrphidicola EA-1 TaxID=1276229 RepID=R4UDT4_9MOLU|nr:hypothetical protein [Spiroplasma syrphidicola]AGM26059.1 hypothetical protein SSYRP_v1c04670 [Spiroplasma syrphidicola EA-1]